MIVSVAYFILYFLLFLAMLALLLFNRKRYAFSPQNTPRISILIAARNEEQTIIRCLEAIEQLQYPKEMIEVLIGDDASTDATSAVVHAYIRDKPNYSCLPITQTVGITRGKANVLAHLARKATTDFFFFTDADIAVPPFWVQAMLGALQEGVGVVTGITTTTQERLFDRIQMLDWLYSLGLMQVVADIGLPVSTMGNNMLLRRDAYEQAGGYENIAFSITEDVAIFNKVVEQGWKARNIYDRSVLAISTPASSFSAFLSQRRRWMRASMHLPYYMVFFFILHGAYYPVLLPFFLYTSVKVALAVFAGKFLLQSTFAAICLHRLGLRVPWWLYILFELYLLLSTLILIVLFFLPLKVSWKGRKY